MFRWTEPQGTVLFSPGRFSPCPRPCRLAQCLRFAGSRRWARFSGVLPPADWGGTWWGQWAHPVDRLFCWEALPSPRSPCTCSSPGAVMVKISHPVTSCNVQLDWTQMWDLNTSTSSGVAATQTVVLRPAALVSPRNLLEMQNLRPMPDPLNQEVSRSVMSDSLWPHGL